MPGQTHRRQSRRWFRQGLDVAICAAFVLMALSPSTAMGSSGGITQAYVNAEWTKATIAGSVDWTSDCQLPPQPPEEWGELPPPPPESEPSICRWVPYATVGPVTDECSSPDRHWPTVGSGVQIVWEGNERWGDGSVAFDLPGVALQYGSSSPLLCLSAVEAVPEGIVCVQIVPSPCPPYVVKLRYYEFDSAQLAPAKGQSPLDERSADSNESTEPKRSADTRTDSNRRLGGPRKHCAKRKRHGRHRHAKLAIGRRHRAISSCRAQSRERRGKRIRGHRHRRQRHHIHRR